MLCPSNDKELSRIAPDDAFGLLGNETRIELLQALWKPYDPYADDNAVSFSNLFDRVGMEDTGNFNYHLEKLTPHFVRQTEDGYERTEPEYASLFERASWEHLETNESATGPMSVLEATTA